METRLPAPCLVVLIGPSSSGKTTWALENFRPNEVVSSDGLRAMVGIDEDDQQAGTAAFDLLDRIVAERLRRKLTTVIDTTGLYSDNRSAWIDMGHKAGIPVYAVVFDTPEEELYRRNSERTRPLPKNVLGKHVSRMRQTVEALDSEGFDGVIEEQAVAVVPPQIATASSPQPADTASGHTFGLQLSRFDWPGDPEARAEQIASVARRAEEAGFRDIWLMDHFRQIQVVGRPWEEIPEAYTTLSYIAGQTKTIRLGSLVTSVTHRYPTVLGKMIATLDVLSGGRAICGIGIGWDRGEHAAYGIDFPPNRDRYTYFEDVLQMLPLLWGKGSPSFEGKLFSAGELICYPRPIQTKIPILIGGSGEKKTLRLVARYADACNVFGNAERVRHKVEVLHRHCADVGRDPDQIEVTHLTSVMTAPDRKTLAGRIDQLRDRNTSPDDYARRHNAGTVDDLVGLFDGYSQAGANHSIVSLPDVALEGSLEAFGDVIASFGPS